MNLSKKEYIKSKAVELLDASDARCFGQLLSQICWSSYGDCFFNGGHNRRYWAGDRFRIVTTIVFESRTFGEQWENVREMTAERLRDIFGLQEEHSKRNHWY